MTGLDEFVSTALWTLARQDNPQGLLAALLGQLRGAVAADLACLVEGRQGIWQAMARHGAEHLLPYDLLAEALDTDEAVSDGRWWAIPLRGNSVAQRVLVLHDDRPDVQREPVDLTAWGDWWAALLEALAARRLDRLRIDQLEAILDIAAQWGQTLEMDQLFEQMAETSTRLLAAERASIFLWDRAQHVLVGRPALGVEEGELRIPDDKGVVGRVIHSGVPQRVDADVERSPINRSVDRQLGFETRTLLCVPLRGRSGELFGAFELVNKRVGNFTVEDESVLQGLATHASVALENSQQYEQLLKSRNQMADQAAAEVQLVGESEPIRALRTTIRRVAETDLAVLLLGENGTGKEVVSRCIHFLSGRRHEPFIAVNCAAIAQTLLESELFGHEKGAFTDAHERRAGKFEAAAGGTLFLDEIGDMSLGGQASLLRVLEEKVVVRVGGSTPIATDVRVIAATNQDLTELVRQKKFRQDLFFRLNVVTLDLPPLRDRGDDILLLAEQFLGDFCRRAGRKLPKFTAAARRRLLQHSWPGNVRELRNLMERIAYLSSGDHVDAEELAFILSPAADSSSWLPDDMPLADATHEFQIQYIERQIHRSQGNMTDAATRLGLHRANLYRKMRQLGLNT